MMAGEFYRTDNLRQKLIAEGFAPRNNSHPELALSAFQAYGKDFARAFEGVFFIVVYDSTHQRIVMTNDRFGLYPHYYNTQ
ncbi:hypothetical protein M3M33_14000, partial [Loigolactobacillus coryniformis]|uniref:hypothetical protein n=1 Tax=Loigolactobacillus coryniformis TaxID=1610 RepID=UPI00201A697A